jgi:hypothetical protein
VSKQSHAGARRERVKLPPASRDNGAPKVSSISKRKHRAELREKTSRPRRFASKPKWVKRCCLDETLSTEVQLNSEGTYTQSQARPQRFARLKFDSPRKTKNERSKSARFVAQNKDPR